MRFSALCLLCFSIDPVKGRVELSLRLSQVDPEAAKKLRMKKERKKKKQTAHTSDGENAEGNNRLDREWHDVYWD